MQSDRWGIVSLLGWDLTNGTVYVGSVDHFWSTTLPDWGVTYVRPKRINFDGGSCSIYLDSDRSAGLQHGSAQRGRFPPEMHALNVLGGEPLRSLVKWRWPCAAGWSQNRRGAGEKRPAEIALRWR